MSAGPTDREFAAWAASMHEEYDAFLRQTWAAMQAAPQGHWIEDTEEHVREAGEAFRRKALEKLSQAPIEAGQKSFSPSPGRGFVAGVASAGNRDHVCGGATASVTRSSS